MRIWHSSHIFRSIFLASICFLYNILGGAQSINNPCCGIMSQNKEHIKNLIGDEDFKVPTRFLYVFMGEVMTDNCLKDDGNVDEKVLGVTMREFLNKNIVYGKGIRYVVRIFPSINASGPSNGNILIHNQATDNGLAYICYPAKLHDIMMSCEEYKPTFMKWKSNRFVETNNLGVADLRNPIMKKAIESLLRVFSEYLKEDVAGSNLVSDTSAPTICKRGDYISRIEIGFAGPWGEGITNYYAEDTDSKALIDIAELYTKYLSDYWLIAPSYGMRKETTKNPKLHDFQYYLLTTTYGKGKEFGLFMDHIGNRDYLRDFTLEKDGIPYKELAQKKGLHAPFIGENNGQFNKEAEYIIDNVRDYRISLCKPWGKSEFDGDSTIRCWREAVVNMGYRFTITLNHFSYKGGRIELDMELANKNVSPCYDDFWQSQLVIRNKNGEMIKTIDLDIDLRNVGISTKEYNKSINVFTKEERRINKKEDLEFFFRVIDKKHINENMFLDYHIRNGKGEYPIIYRQ